MGLLDEYGVRTDGSTGITVTEYIYNMDECIAACDMLITRSGAITLAELTCLGKPAILIPSPNVTENHQYHNACVLRDAGAAVMIEEKDLTGETLYETLLEIACDSGVMREMGRRSRDLAHMRAAQRIVDDLKYDYNVVYDEKDSVGKRYRRQDAIGTPFCVTVDGQTLEDGTVTVRHRDTMEQERVMIESLPSLVEEECSYRKLFRKMNL